MLVILTLPVGAVAKYCDVYVCVCLSVSAQGYLRNYMRDLYQIFMHIAYGRGSILPRRRCNTLCTSGFVDDIMFFSIMGHIAVVASALSKTLDCSPQR